MLRRLGMVTVTAITLIAVGVVPGAGAPGSSFTHLNPGGPPNLTERIPINFVFVGYEPSQVNQPAFLAELPARARPVVRSRLWYGVVEPVGLHYSFQYRVTYTDAAYENQFSPPSVLWPRRPSAPSFRTCTTRRSTTCSTSDRITSSTRLAWRSG